MTENSNLNTEDGANLGITAKFLEQKKKQAAAKAASMKGKNVDRKASKNRKIKYVVLDKLLNFMTPEDWDPHGTNRSDILKALFGSQPIPEASKQKPLVGKKRQR